jgi:hypothetical protein
LGGKQALFPVSLHGSLPTYINVVNARLRYFSRIAGIPAGIIFVALLNSVIFFFLHIFSFIQMFGSYSIAILV